METIDSHVDNLNQGINNCVLFSMGYVDILELAINEQVKQVNERCEWRVSQATIQLTSYISLFYLNTNHRIDQVVFHHSPSLFGIIAWLAITISNIIIFVKDIIDILHVVEILKAADILAALWPAFRVRLDEIYGKVAEASQQLGFGVDGLIHLIQATQSSITVLGGVLGKDDLWSEAQIGEQALKTTERIAVLIHQFENNPSYAFRAIFASQDWSNKRKISEWWNKAATWLFNTTETAEKAIKGINQLSNNLLDLKNQLPSFIRDHIPQVIWDGLEWSNKTIDQTLLPAIANIDNTLKSVNSELDQQRAKAAELTYQLELPGSLLEGIDNLPGPTKAWQQLKIDDVVSRQYNEDADKYELDDKELIDELDKTSALFEAGIPPLTFMTLEDNIPSVNPEIIKEPFETWFVGGYKSQY